MFRNWVNAFRKVDLHLKQKCIITQPQSKILQSEVSTEIALGLGIGTWSFIVALFAHV
jgi:hypothetical protein